MAVTVGEGCMRNAVEDVSRRQKLLRPLFEGWDQKWWPGEEGERPWGEAYQKVVCSTGGWE